jgi:TonB family protein
MRGRAWLVALLLSSLELAAQSSEPSSSLPAPSSHDPQAQQKPDSARGGPPTKDKVADGKVVTQGLLIHKVAPKYPKAARKAHIEGTVVLSATIGKDGRIANLRAVSGPEALIESAVKAVKQWRYKPYLLDGEAVEVDSEIRVNFQLN